MAAGELSHRIAFEERALQSDGYGNARGAFEERFIVWAKVQARFGGETVMAARLSGQQPVTIMVRQNSRTLQVTEAWRARDAESGMLYNIRSIVDPDDRGAWLELLCQAGVAT